MEVRELELSGVYEFRPRVIGDSRGYFSETYKVDEFRNRSLTTAWVQENLSYSTRLHTLRGLHFQLPPYAQTKLVSVSKGEVLDVFVDIRKGSPTYGKWDAVKLVDKECNSVYVPAGFAHGFCTLTEEVVVEYKVDNPYKPDHERAFMWNDPDIGVEWDCEQPYLSERDKTHPKFVDFESPFEYKG